MGWSLREEIAAVIRAASASWRVSCNLVSGIVSPASTTVTKCSPQQFIYAPLIAYQPHFTIRARKLPSTSFIRNSSKSMPHRPRSDRVDCEGYSGRSHLSSVYKRSCLNGQRHSDMGYRRRCLFDQLDVQKRTTRVGLRLLSTPNIPSSDLSQNRRFIRPPHVIHEKRRSQHSSRMGKLVQGKLGGER